MKSVTSKDGTIITFDQLGQGAPVVLVSGGSVDKGSNMSLAEALAKHFTVYNYDRRGRSKSVRIPGGGGRRTPSLGHRGRSAGPRHGKDSGKSPPADPEVPSIERSSWRRHPRAGLRCRYGTAVARSRLEHPLGDPEEPSV